MKKPTVSPETIRVERIRLKTLEKDLIKSLKYVVKVIFLDRYKSADIYALKRLRGLSDKIFKMVMFFEDEIREFENYNTGVFLEAPEATPENIKKAINKVKSDLNKQQKERITREANKGY